MIPPFKQFISITLQAVNKKQGTTREEMVRFLSDYFDLSKEDLEMRTSSNENVVYNRLGWALTYLKRAKMIEKLKNGYKITQNGKNLLALNYPIIDNYILAKYSEEFRIYQKIDFDKKDMRRKENKHLK